MTTPPNQSLDEILGNLISICYNNGSAQNTDPKNLNRASAIAKAAILRWARAQKPEKKKPSDATYHNKPHKPRPHPVEYDEDGEPIIEFDPISVCTMRNENDGWNAALDAYEAKFSNSEEET